MEEVQPLEAQISGGGGGTATVPAIDYSETVGTKRQRRPSVRLGDIGGDQPYDSQSRRSIKNWKFFLDNHHHHRNNKDSSIRTSKIRPLTNFGFSGASGSDPLDTLEASDREREANLETLAIGSWKVKESKKRGSIATKRPRSNWVSSKIHDEAEGDNKYRPGDDGDDRYRDFEFENSESHLKEQSPIQSLDNLAVDGHGNGNGREVLYNGSRRPIRTRVSEARGDNHDGVELSGPSDTDAREWKYGGEDGVRVWLNGLGLGRYAPVFEIHEVDDEVLPLLTLEDLKDMGINAVGSRRKMFYAIQKLGKGFS